MKNTLSSIVSYILHPLLIPTYIIILLLNLNIFLAFMIPFNVRLLIIGMIFTVTFAMPAMIIYVLHRKGVITSLKMEQRKERFYPILITTIFWGLGYFMISRTGLPLAYYLFLSGGIAALLIAMVINFFWKISLHMLGMGGLTGLLLGFSFRIGVDVIYLLSVIILLSGLVGYARLKENSHNPPQVYVGYIVGVFLMTLIYIFPFI